MTPAERAAFSAYLNIQRRTLLAQVKACEDLIAVIENELNRCYNGNKSEIKRSEKVAIEPV